MSIRDIQNISPNQDKNAESKPDATSHPKLPPASIPKEILLNYPRPIALSQLIEETAQWSGYTFIMDPSLDREVQIFAPHRLTRDQAFGLVLATTENAGLRMVELEEHIIKIVPASFSQLAV